MKKCTNAYGFPLTKDQINKYFFDLFQIVYGEADYGLGRESKNNLELILTSTQPQELAKARHPAYLDQPKQWHQLIFNFMKALE